MKISNQEAECLHSISTDHERMPSGELRFRIKKADGTGYIRTEASEKSGWQNSHYHNIVRETYTVQSRWLAYALLQKGKSKPKIQIYNEGESFTTQPHIVHNIYLPANATIHTVKHGPPSIDDWQTNKKTIKLDKKTKKLSEENIRILAQMENNTSTATEEVYTEAYRHLDNLIWQVPSWSTAILVGIFAFTNFPSDNSSLDKNYFVQFFLALMFIVLSVFSYALYRFRKRQWPLKLYRKTPILKSAQTYLQLIVTLESLSLLFGFFISIEFSRKWSFLIPSLIFLVVTFLYEKSVRKV